MRGVVREHVEARRQRRERVQRERALLRELHLKQRIAGARAIRQQRGNEPVIRHILMLVRGQHRLLRRSDERAQRRIGIDGHPQHLHVDEIADDRLRCFVPAVRHRRADADIALAARRAQRSAEDREHHHEERRLLFAAAILQSRRQRSRQTEHVVALRARRSGPALEETRTARSIAVCAQLRAPVVDLPRDRFGIDSRVLPRGEVRVLRRRGVRMSRARRRDIRAIRIRERFEQHVHRQTIRDDVMQRDHEPMRMLVHPYEMRTQQRTALQIEGRARRLVREPFERSGIAAQVGERQDDQRAFLDDLHGLAIVIEFETRPQDVVPRNERVEGALHRIGLQGAVDRQHAAHVVRVAVGIVRPGHPQRALRMRSPHDAALLRRKPHERRLAKRRARCDALADFGSRRAQGRRGEYVARIVGDLPLRAHIRGDAHRRQRIAAEPEEAVVAARGRGVERLAPDRRELHLDVVEGFARLFRRRHAIDARALHEPRIRVERAVGEALHARGALHLAARCLRQCARFEQHDRSRRFAARERDCFAHRRCEHIGRHELAHAARHFGRHADALRAVHLHRECRDAPASHEFHVAFDREFQILRIEIAPAHDQEILDASRDIETFIEQKAQIAGAQPAHARAFDEALRRGLRTAPVARRHARPAHPDFADNAIRQRRAALAMHDHHRVIRGRHAARHERDIACFRALGDAAFERIGAQRCGRHARAALHARREQRRFREAVAGIQRARIETARREAFDESIERRMAHRFRSREGDAPARQIERGELIVADTIRAQAIREVGPARNRPAMTRDRFEPAHGPFEKVLRRHQHERNTAEDRLRHRADETHVVIQGQPAHEYIVRGHAEAFANGDLVRPQAAVRDHHALGRRCGAGRVLQKCEFRRCHVRRFDRAFACIECIDFDHARIRRDRRERFTITLRQRMRGQHEARVGVARNRR
ncbi:hypothetical protein NOV72_05195 [Caballeronia novacaledonica]|uniref:Uncharacterized protein n=1 Tax=Caballeronia novacaledonica TaxID=1544861 RepID=A0A2U3ICP9_9BURK|nr:hypothetical protein NOV72_05195 [Caballeronia novacaledonica]